MENKNPSRKWIFSLLFCWMYARKRKEEDKKFQIEFEFVTTFCACSTKRGSEVWFSKWELEKTEWVGNRKLHGRMQDECHFCSKMKFVEPKQTATWWKFMFDRGFCGSFFPLPVPFALTHIPLLMPLFRFHWFAKRISDWLHFNLIFQNPSWCHHSRNAPTASDYASRSLFLYVCMWLVG